MRAARTPPRETVQRILVPNATRASPTPSDALVISFNTRRVRESKAMRVEMRIRHSKRPRPNPAYSVAAAAAGAGAMYLLDRGQGPRRRSYVRDGIIHLLYAGA